MKWRRWCEQFPGWHPGEKERWEEMASGGRFRFVLVYGVLFWGGLCALGMTVLMHLSPTFDTPLPRLLAINVAIFAFSGALYGHVLWWATSKSYEENFGSSREISRE